MNLSVNVNITASPEILGVLQSIASALTVIKPNQVDSSVPVQPAVSSAAPQLQQGPSTQNQVSMPSIVPTTQPQQQTLSLQQPMQTQQPQPNPVPNGAPGQMPTIVPTTGGQPTYTMDQLAVAATALIDAGRRNEVVNLLTQFGIQALTALPKEQYGNFATALRGLGARI